MPPELAESTIALPINERPFLPYPHYIHIEKLLNGPQRPYAYQPLLLHICIDQLPPLTSLHLPNHTLYISKSPHKSSPTR